MLPQTHPSLLTLLYTSLATAAQVQDASDCPGVFSTGTSGGICCVGGKVQIPYNSVCSGWPVCQGPTTTTQTQNPFSCATVINYSDPDYTSLVQAASSSLEASGTHYQTTLPAVGATAGAGVSSVASTTGMGSGPSSTTTAVQPPSSSGGAGAAKVQLGVLGGVVLGAAALLERIR